MLNLLEDLNLFNLKFRRFRKFLNKQHKRESVISDDDAKTILRMMQNIACEVKKLQEEVNELKKHQTEEAKSHKARLEALIALTRSVFFPVAVGIIMALVGWILRG